MPSLLPLRHGAIHQSDEASIVRRLKQVHHLMDDDVLKALDRLLGLVRIQSNAGGSGIAASPSRFHPPRPIGGWTLKCTFLIALKVTSASISPSLILVTVGFPFCCVLVGSASLQKAVEDNRLTLGEHHHHSQGHRPW